MLALKLPSPSGLADDVCIDAICAPLVSFCDENASALGLEAFMFLRDCLELLADTCERLRGR
ncbi:hypothetical protein DC434_13905 [Microbacterium sp. TPD7012]|nr:hypothetical protein DC434_13905 [Microbacterium sp. TPD7012]